MTRRTRKFLRRATIAVALLAVTITTGCAYEFDAGAFPWGDFAIAVVNFAIFAGIIYYFGKDYIQQFFANRRAEFVREMEAAQQARKEAEAKLEEYNAKLEALEQQRQALLDEYHAQGEREKQRIIDETKQQVEKMRRDAEATIDQEVKRARAMLENQAVQLAVDLARDKAIDALDDDAQQALFSSYLEGLDASGKSPN